MCCCPRGDRPDFVGGCSRGRMHDGAAGGHGSDPDAGSASARLRELHAGRARRRARRGGPCDLGAPAHAGAVRARRSTAPTPRAVPGLPGAVRHLHRPVLAAVRLDRARHGHLGSGGRVPTLALDPSASVRQDTGTRAGTSADGHDRRAPDRGDRLIPFVPEPTGARATGPGRPRPAPERAVHDSRWPRRPFGIVRRRHRPAERALPAR